MPADTTYGGWTSATRGDQREEALYGKSPWTAMWYSSNTVFSQVGVQLGSD
ncbi:MAG: hypothetical protein ACLUE1_02080 [Adlercreutzia equolifaciens]